MRNAVEMPKGTFDVILKDAKFPPYRRLAPNPNTPLILDMVNEGYLPEYKVPTYSPGKYVQQFGRGLRQPKPPVMLYHDLSVFEALTLNRRKRGSFGCYAGLAFVVGFALAVAWYL